MGTSRAPRLVGLTLCSGIGAPEVAIQWGQLRIGLKTCAKAERPAAVREKSGPDVTLTDTASRMNVRSCEASPKRDKIRAGFAKGLCRRLFQ